MSRPIFSLQPLESRRFLSAAHAVAAECPDVVEAREDLQEVAADLRDDRRAGRRAIAAIRVDIVEELRRMYAENGDAIREAVAPLREQLASVIRELGSARREILDDLRGIRETWQPTIQADIEAVHAARAAGDAEAEAAALDKFHAHRSALYAELNPLKQDLIEVTKEKGQRMSEIRAAIDDALAEFSPTLESLLDRLRQKAADVAATLTAGHNAVVAAQEKLRAELEECREDHAGEHPVA